MFLGALANLDYNIIQIHNNVMWDWEYFAEYSSHCDRMYRIFFIILLVPQNIVMDLNDVMAMISIWLFLKRKDIGLLRLNLGTLL